MRVRDAAFRGLVAVDVESNGSTFAEAATTSSGRIASS
jgi:hypothetical protein